MNAACAKQAPLSLRQMMASTWGLTCPPVRLALARLTGGVLFRVALLQLHIG